MTMKLNMIPHVFLFSFAALSVLTHQCVSAHEGHSCACEAEEFGFTIDCSATDAMLAALSELQSGGCATDCSSESCLKSWLIVQSHHDYCPTDAVPIEVEDSFHDYDEICESCEIGRQPIEGLPDCPAVSNCADGSGNTAYTALITDGCLSNGCDATLCQDNYFLLRAFHDNCDHDSISQEAEEGIHDLEDVCVPANVNCNSADTTDDSSLVCVAEAEKTADSASSSLLFLFRLSAAVPAWIMMMTIPYL